MRISKDTLVSWTQGPGKTEAEKCANAETAVRKAIAGSKPLSLSNVTVFVQGSYRARTNVRQDSDVDICVRYNGAFFGDYPTGMTAQDFALVDGTLDFSDFKELVGHALKERCGNGAVRRGKKAFDVHANTYRIDADVVPAFEHRRYTGQINPDGSDHYVSGIAFFPDNAGMIVNWPDQSYENGVQKNNATGRCYKRIIRVLKRLRNRMQDDGIKEANDIASFLIECLVWNAPLEAFRHDTYAEDVRYVIAHIWNQTRKDDDCSNWGEVNELKYLFRASQPWTRQQANQFLEAAWNYIGFE